MFYHHEIKGTPEMLTYAPDCDPWEDVREWVMKYEAKRTKKRSLNRQIQPIAAKRGSG